jgi:hypothetical protein
MFQLINIVTVPCVVYFYRNKTNVNIRKLILFEKLRNTGRIRIFFHHSFSSTLIIFFPE